MQDHFENIARKLDKENTQLKKAFEIMYPFVIKHHGKQLSKSESELLLSLKFPRHGK